MTLPPSELDRPALVRDILARGAVDVEIEAGAGERSAIAARLGLIGLERLSARLRVAPWQDGGIEVSGTFAADAIQACVVTLDPVPAHLEAPVLARYEAASGAPRVQGPEDPERFDLLDPDAPDPPDPLPQDGKILLGELVIQHLAVALDPYPRKADAALPDEVTGAAGRENPFSKLASLKKPGR